MNRDYNIEAIKNGLDECLTLIPSHSMSNLTEVLKQSISKLDEPMQLAIIGKISSSKSTLVNAILGKDELMITGQKEVTYNVGWLKYGATDSDIIIHYKDGSTPVRKKYSDFGDLSAGDQKSGIDNISYIETFNDAEILKEINIIDTPGLDALRKIDSQNTLDFIQKVRPDAVIMLFTHSVADNVLDVVKQFNTGTTLNPLNAIGVLSKIDILWEETRPRDKSAMHIGTRISKRLNENSGLRRTLFNIYPVSALLYLAATTLGQKDIDDITEAYNCDPEFFRKSLNSTQKFLSNENITLSQQRRKELIGRLGLYGIWIIVDKLQRDEKVNLSAIKETFLKESGAEYFTKILHNHFGVRAKLIKIESVYQHIRQTIQQTKAQLSNNTSFILLLSNIEQKISDIFLSIVHEHREYEILNSIYDGTLQLENDVKDEFCRLCGESGNSAPERLGVSAEECTIDQLLDIALSREKYWRKMVALEPDPEEKEWMNVILKSYSNLRSEISTMKFQYEQAKCFLFNNVNI